MGHTLSYHRRMCAMVFGEDSLATKYLDEKIAKLGEDEEVIVDEGQLIAALAQIHMESKAVVVSGERLINTLMPEKEE
jgi:hypothetical protein